jgi:hypothetical protein
LRDLAEPLHVAPQFLDRPGKIAFSKIATASREIALAAPSAGDPSPGTGLGSAFT